MSENCCPYCHCAHRSYAEFTHCRAEHTEASWDRPPERPYQLYIPLTLPNFPPIEGMFA